MKTAFAASLLLSTLALAAPAIEKRQSDCPAFPWFIAPLTANDCSAQPIAVQPNSGYASNPSSATCQFLDPADQQTFQAVQTTIECGGWVVTLYDASDPNCESTQYETTAENQCFLNGNFLKYSAQPL